MLALINSGSSDLVASVLVKVVRLYGNRERVEDEMKAECLRLIKDKFQLLGPHEILLAYRLWASGDLGEIKAAEMYGGQFNARQLGAILSEYVGKERRTALKQYHSIQDAQKKSDERLKVEQEKADYDRKFPAMIEAAKGSDLRPVLAIWYDTAIRLGIMPEPDKETKLKYFDIAKKNYYDDLSMQPGFVTDPFKLRAEHDHKSKTEHSTIANLAKAMILKDVLL
jgi:hypothetical protein